MTSMIERVAVTINPSAFKYRDDLFRFCISRGDDEEEAHKTADWAHGAECKEAMRKARAAIEAMSDPTDTMKLAGGFKCEAIMFEDDPDGTGVIFNDMGHVYRAMIDAALKEGK